MHPPLLYCWVIIYSNENNFIGNCLYVCSCFTSLICCIYVIVYMSFCHISAGLLRLSFCFYSQTAAPYKSKRTKHATHVRSDVIVLLFSESACIVTDTHRTSRSTSPSKRTRLIDVDTYARSVSPTAAVCRRCSVYAAEIRTLPDNIRSV